jgi:hypothetical protein
MSAPSKPMVIAHIRCADGFQQEIVVEVCFSDIDSFCYHGSSFVDSQKKKCSGREIWEQFTTVFDVHERDFFGLQYQTWSGVDVKISAAEGTYKLGRATPRWLMFNEPALAQLGDPIERDDGWAVWEFDCKVRFYLSPMITDNWDKFTRYPFLVPSLILDSIIFGLV